MDQEPEDLEDLIERMAEADGKGNRVSLDNILDAVGRRSFGPLLLTAGLVTLAPVVGDIPGVPILMGLVVILTAVQILMNRDHFWLPDWLLKRSVSRTKLCKALAWLRRPARFIDRLLRPRLGLLVEKPPFICAIAIACIAVAALTPAMEFVPFSATVAGVAFTGFGLALISHDGIPALFAFAFTIGIYVCLIYYFI